ncbi:MAG: prepilin-type N-terminal cleavage/methylation domain-containing protein [Deltaproteobacteria bacterium]|nr:prepilin-type N-terminal cleavage/methylation domain-containing protein [Deltaproteobacteria bacterium]
MKTHIKTQGGFSLIEIIIVLGIIAVVMALGADMIGTPTNHMRDVSSNIVKVVRYVYNQAALNNQYYRVVFNITEKKYHVEYSETPFYVIWDNDEVEAIRINNEEKNKTGSDDGGEAPQAASVGSFVEYEDELLKIFELPANIKFSDIYVEHQEKELEEGKAYIYFFPKGRAEFAVIHLAEEGDEENIMTLVVNPLTAAVTILTEYRTYESLINDMGSI